MDSSAKQRFLRRYEEGGLLNVVRHTTQYGYNEAYNQCLSVHNSLHRAIDDGIAVVDEDWDNLLILDACRADLFTASINTAQFDAYRTVRSKGSTTAEWLSRNFPGSYGDIVYVSGNPNTANEVSDSFHKLIEVWRSDYDEEIGTVRHGSIIEALRAAIDNHPDKRLIGHFMQPHHPFIPQPDDDDGWSAIDDAGGGVQINPEEQTTIWDALEAGRATHDEVWAGYRANLELVLDDVIRFARELPGKTVITSDHGNAFGERPLLAPKRIFAHPPNVRLDPLVKVPWAEIDGKRREIVAEEVSSSSTTDEEIVEQRLRELGYR